MDYNWLLKLDWKFSISTIIALITLILVYMNHRRNKPRAKLSIYKFKLSKHSRDFNLFLFLTLHIENKGQISINVRKFKTILDNEVLKPSNQCDIMDLLKSEIHPNEKRYVDINFRAPDDAYDIEEWEKKYNNKTVRIYLVDDNTGKEFESKKYKVKDILEET